MLWIGVGEDPGLGAGLRCGGCTEFEVGPVDLWGEKYILHYELLTFVPICL